MTCLSLPCAEPLSCHCFAFVLWPRADDAATTLSSIGEQDHFGHHQAHYTAPPLIALPQSVSSVPPSLQAVPGSAPSPHKQSLLSALPPIATDTSNETHRTRTGSMRSPSSMLPPMMLPRLPSMQLISPTGGPLYPRPTGLVGFPPLSPPLTTTSSATPSPAPLPSSIRPRSNSFSSATVSPSFSSQSTWSSVHTANPADQDTEFSRRGSVAQDDRRMSVASSNGSSSGGWIAIDPSNSRMRKRGSDAHLHAPDAALLARYNRPRTSSSSGIDDTRGFAAWAPILPDRDPYVRDSVGISDQHSNGSVESSPRTPGGESDFSRRGSHDQIDNSRRPSTISLHGGPPPHTTDALRSLAAAASERMDERPRGTSSSTSPRTQSSTYSPPHQYRNAYHRPLHSDLAAMHINQADRRRGLPSPVLAGVTPLPRTTEFPSSAHVAIPGAERRRSSVTSTTLPPWPSVKATPVPAGSPPMSSEALPGSPSMGPSSFHASFPVKTPPTDDGSYVEGSTEAGRYGCPHCREFSQPAYMCPLVAHRVLSVSPHS